MKKFFLLLLLASSLLYGELYKIPDFEADLFSKEGNKLKKIELSIMFDGDNLHTDDYKLLDALNVVISSFYIEDLFTSKGKERFKTLLKNYILKKYMMDIDFIYILHLTLHEQIDTDQLLKKIEKLEKGMAPVKSGKTTPISPKQQLPESTE